MRAVLQVFYQVFHIFFNLKSTPSCSLLFILMSTKVAETADLATRDILLHFLLDGDIVSICNLITLTFQWPDVICT